MSIGSSSAIGATMRMQTQMAAAKAAREEVNGGSKQAHDEPTATTTAGSKEAAGRVGDVWQERAASSDGPRHEVDRRIEDGKSVRVTVVSYSDGSTESLMQLKVDEIVSEVVGSLDAVLRDVEPPNGSDFKGMLVNGLA